MSVRYYGYPKCTTCKKAEKWLKKQGPAFESHNIAEQPPSADELRQMVETAELPLKKFFNTSGQKYRELGLKDKLPSMNEEEQLQLLASDGMLIKRPLVTDGAKTTVGFSEQAFENAWKK